MGGFKYEFSCIVLGCPCLVDGIGWMVGLNHFLKSSSEYFDYAPRL